MDAGVHGRRAVGVLVRADAVHLELLEQRHDVDWLSQDLAPQLRLVRMGRCRPKSQTTYRIRISNSADTSDFVTSPEFTIYQTPARSPASSEATVGGRARRVSNVDMLNEAVYTFAAYMACEGFDGGSADFKGRTVISTAVADLT